MKLGEMNPQREKILVLCRAIPEESQKYIQTVCAAGITDGLDFRRLYPVPFKPLRPGGGIPFHKKEWIEVTTSLADDRRDQRRESRKLDMGSVRVLGKSADEDIRLLIQPVVSQSIQSIEASGASLGLIRPKILDYDLNIISTDLMENQTQLMPDGSVARGGKIKLEQESIYHFVCGDQAGCTCGNQPHKMRILDWEVNELYRHVVERTTDHGEIQAKMRQKWFDWMVKERDMYFMMGTHHRWKVWMIVSVLYLGRAEKKPKKLTASLRTAGPRP